VAPLEPFLALCLAVLQAAPPASAAQDVEALWRQGQRSAAIEAQRAALAREPGNLELRRSLVERELAVHWYQAALDHCAGLGPAGEPLRAKALYFLHRFEEALEILPQTGVEALSMRQAAAERLGLFELADQALLGLRAAMGGDHPSVRTLEGQRLARMGDAAAAIPHFRAALERDPTQGAALYGLGRALLESGEREAGLAALERHRELVKLLDQWDFARRGVDLAPEHAPNLAQLAEAERALGRDDRARERFREAEARARGEEIAPIALRHARLYSESLGDVDEAVRVLERAAAQQPDVRLFVRAGDVLLAAGRGIDAVQRFYKARELRPDDPQIAARIEAARAAYVKPESER
jgi:tetratricopeptide (TPR) repeat protein